MNYIKNLIKVLLFAQCLFLFCVCDKKEIVTTEQNILNLADFVKCPFKEEFDDKTDLEKYVLKKFGKPYTTNKLRRALYDHCEVVVDKIKIEYEESLFRIHRGVSKRFEVFERIYGIPDDADLKYGIKRKETTIKDIERLFGKPEVVTIIKDFTSYKYTYNTNQYKYKYDLDIRFINGKYIFLSIDTRIECEALR